MDSTRTQAIILCRFLFAPLEHSIKNYCFDWIGSNWRIYNNVTKVEMWLACYISAVWWSACIVNVYQTFYSSKAILVFRTLHMLSGRECFMPQFRVTLSTVNTSKKLYVWAKTLVLNMWLARFKGKWISSSRKVMFISCRPLQYHTHSLFS